MTAMTLAKRFEQAAARIARHNGETRSMITPLIDIARRAVGQAEAEPFEGALAGVLVSVKDNIDTAGVRTTRGSEFFGDRIPNGDASVVERLRRAGAILIGKDNLHEFAFGATSQNPHHGLCRNPWNLNAIPGGSSGGAGASVAAGFSEVALGTDTGGSVRIPAALNGVAGLRPTVGRISNHGVMPVSEAYDTVGPLARTVRGVADAYEAIAGFDRRDAMSVDRPVEGWRSRHAAGLGGVRIGAPAALIAAQADPEVAALVEAASAWTIVM
jgi:aspartyl-tRNA(Asn)/glutamyl-tRNA(Gln) amidotransferase subunit A